MMSDAKDYQLKIAQLNARMDRLPVWGLDRRVFVVVGIAYWFAFYDLSSVAFTLPHLGQIFHLKGYQIALPVTANLVGYSLGAFILGTVADYVGRRKAMLYTVLLLAMGGLLTAFSWNDSSLAIFRFITGLGMGADISMAAAIMGEFSPARHRGRNIQYNYLWGAAGLATTPFIAIAFLHMGPLGWRFVFGIGALVAVVGIFMRDRWLPESPRWLALHGQWNEAEKLVSEMEHTAQMRTGQALPAVPEVPAENILKGFPTMELFRPPYLRRLIVVVGFWLIWYITVYAFLGYEPTLLIKMGLSVHNGLMKSAIGYLATPVAALLVLVVIDKIQRKYLVSLVTFIFAAACVLLATSSGAFTLFLGSALASMMIAANAAAYVYTAEAFPTRARASGTAIGIGVSHLGGASSAFIVVAALHAFGARGTFWLLGAIVALSGLIMLVGGVKTTGDGLTEIAK